MTKKNNNLNNNLLIDFAKKNAKKTYYLSEESILAIMMAVNKAMYLAAVYSEDDPDCPHDEINVTSIIKNFEFSLIGNKLVILNAPEFNMTELSDRIKNKIEPKQEENNTEDE